MFAVIVMYLVLQMFQELTFDMVTSDTFLTILCRHMYQPIVITRSGQMLFVLYKCKKFDNPVSITIRYSIDDLLYNFICVFGKF